MYAYRQTEADGRYIFVNGGISGLDTTFNAIVFDQIKLVEAKLGGLCEQEPHGVISVTHPMETGTTCYLMAWTRTPGIWTAHSAMASAT